MSDFTAFLIIFGPAVLFLILFLIQRKKSKTLTRETLTLQEQINALKQYEGIVEIDKLIAQKRADAEKELGQIKYETSKIEKEAKAKADSIVESAENEAEYTVNNAELKAKKIISSAQNELDSANEEKKNIIAQARQKAEEIKMKSDAAYSAAQREASKIISDARTHAQNIAGDAFELKEKAEHLSAVAAAMQNKIEGYGNEYIIPNRMLLDDLADTYSYTQASADYKSIETQMNNMIKTRSAAICTYAGRERIEAGMDFCVDAFNGKLSSILTKVKTSNYGILKQELADAYTLVNHLGSGSRSVRITEQYYRLAQEKLRLAALLVEMKEKDREEQRAIREQMREEERARREIEKAMKDAAKQEEMLQKAMEKARAKYEAANEEQKAKYEAQLSELEAKLKEAEEQNKRAQSMAEQTKRGHVYIISNIGSFGEDIYKIGMTRRLAPQDRIDELSGAAVPFRFDVHAFIFSADAPRLESKLHNRFAHCRVNMVNGRKEFYHVKLEEIEKAVHELTNEFESAEFIQIAQAQQFRESIRIRQSAKNNTSYEYSQTEEL